jgi:hypothetical protein
MSEYERGFDAGFESGYQAGLRHMEVTGGRAPSTFRRSGPMPPQNLPDPSKKKRKLSAWNKFVKANSKKPRFKYKSGAKKGKLNLKAMAVAFRKTPGSKKSKK